MRIPPIPPLDGITPETTTQRTHTYTTDTQHTDTDTARSTQRNLDSIFTKILHAPKGNRSEKSADIHIENTDTGESLHGFIHHITFNPPRIRLHENEDKHPTIDALPGENSVLVTREAKQHSRIPSRRFYADAVHVTESIIEYNDDDITQRINEERQSPGETYFASDFRNISRETAFRAAPYNREVTTSTLSPDLLVFERLACREPDTEITIELHTVAGQNISCTRPAGPFYDTRLRVTDAELHTGSGRGNVVLGDMVVEHLPGTTHSVARVVDGDAAFIVSHV